MVLAGTCTCNSVVFLIQKSLVQLPQKLCVNFEVQEAIDTQTMREVIAFLNLTDVHVHCMK